jgi:hypothetical protein
MTTSAPDRERVPVLQDMLNGIFRGDFAKRLGPAGALTQMVVGFVPVAGTVAALRDLLADWAAGDALGVLLNIVALFPIFGGFAKTAEVLHHLRRLHRSLQGHGTSGPTHSAMTELGAAPLGPRGPNAYSLLSLLMGVTAPLLSPGLAIYGLTSLAPRLGWTSSQQRLGLLIVSVFLAPVLGILFGHLASHRARRLHGRHAPHPLARVGLILGYLYLVGFAAILALVLSLTPLT